MSEFTLAIDGMHCGSCVRRVTQALNTVQGLEVEEVRVGAARLKAESNPPPVNDAVEAVSKAGYSARLEP